MFSDFLRVSKFLAFLTLLSAAASAATTLNVLSFGASGNGSNNDTAPIQAAINACASGDTVYIPTGTYSIDTLYLRPGCNVKGDRASSVLIARSRIGAMLYATDVNRNSTIENLVFDMNNQADAGVKFDWQLTGGIIRYNLFKNGGGMGSVFIPGGAIASDRHSSIDHNIFKNVTHGINTYNKMWDTNIDWNYMDGFDQGISAGGCKHELPAGTGVTVEHNTFTQGRRMAIEFCGRFSDFSVQSNYITNWAPSRSPASENYAGCSATYPYMCDSMGISLAVGGTGVTAAHNRIYRQPGTSWGIEWVVTQPPASTNYDNIIKNAGLSMQDESCIHMGGSTNCAITRQSITNNYGCGGNTGWNASVFSNWPSSNYYFPSCSDPRFPAEEPMPAMPFSLSGNGGGQPPQVTLTSPSAGTSFSTGTTIAVTSAASDPDGSISKVEFYRNGSLMATATSAPYTYNWSNPAAGSYSLSARATDNSGISTSSSSVTVTIKAPNQAPKVALTSPIAGSTLSAPANILMSATASDADGSISKVEFLQGSAVVATISSAPFSFSWSNVPAGSYSLSARATDNAGAVSTSAPVSLTVSASSSTAPVFYKGINLNGPAVTIEGNSWISYSSALSSGLSVQNANLWSGSYSFTPSPTPDAGTSSMLQSAAFRAGSSNGTGFSLNQSLPNGTYQVFVWAIENFQSNSRNIDLKLEGVTAAQGLGDLPFGAWKKYGPFATTVSDGVLNIDVLRGSKGDPGLVGIALYSVPASTVSQPAQVAPASPAASATPKFFRGINLNGPAVTIEGNIWMSYATALGSGFTVLNASVWSGVNSFTPSPVADAATSTILQSALWRPASTNGTSFSMNQTVPNGTYQVYVWAVENYASNYRNMDLKLEGVTAAQGIGDLPFGSWKKYGPYTTTVSDGVLNMDVLRSTKGDPGLVGVAIYSVN